MGDASVQPSGAEVPPAGAPVRWTMAQLLDATQGKLVRGRAEGVFREMVIDSRRTAPGDVFVAIRGQRLDGHQFVDEAAHHGATCLVVSEVPRSVNGASALPTILVEDTTEALGNLARYHRRRIGATVIAVTGSCGKTTTKDLIAHLIDGSRRVHKSFSSFNNHIGVPLTLLQLQPDHQVAVVELGSNHPGEIAYLASIAEPDAAVITNVGPSHLEFFGSLMEVLHEKLSLLESLPVEGCAVLPGDQLDVCLEARQYLEPHVRVVTFGSTDRCDIQATDIERVEGGMAMRLRDHHGQWVTPLVGYHNMENALAALAAAWAVGMPLSAARRRIGSFQAATMRSELLARDGLTILNDCYNANPLSFARALEALRDLTVRRKVAIVGDMLELGTFAPSAHRAIGRLATQLGIDTVLAVGEYAEEVALGVRELRPEGALTYHSVAELLAMLPSVLQRGDGLLIKGSRRMNLEQVTEFLVQRYPSLDDAHAG